MKHTFFFCFLIAFFNAKAQGDSMPIGRVVYLQQVSTEGDLQNNGFATLLFNKEMSLYSQNGAPKSDSSFQDGSLFGSSVAGDFEGFPIQKLHKERILYVKEPCPRYSKSHCVIRDTFMTIDWTIHPEHKRFGPYSCNKATGKFRGRDYEVWFTPEIPVSTGPFKLGGLPGLILEAKSMDGAVLFKFEELVLSGNISGIIKKPSGKDIGMSYKSFIEDQDKYHKLLIANAKAKGFEISVSRMERIELDTEH